MHLNHPEQKVWFITTEAAVMKQCNKKNKPNLIQGSKQLKFITILISMLHCLDYIYEPVDPMEIFGNELNCYRFKKRKLSFQQVLHRFRLLSFQKYKKMLPSKNQDSKYKCKIKKYMRNLQI